MSLRLIVAVLGGDIHSGGRSANVPAPGHSRADRSVSLLLDGDRVVIHGFGAADWRAVHEHLQGLGLIDPRGRLNSQGVQPRLGGGEPPQRLAARLRISRAQAIWSEALPLLRGDLCHRYFRRRGIDMLPDDIPSLRRHPCAPVAVYREAGETRPALVAGIQSPDGAVGAVEIAYLDVDGRAARFLRLPRKTVGVVPAGSAVRLHGPEAVMLVGEGVVTTLSAMTRFRLPGWALLSAGNLARWSPPPLVRRVLIAGDRGQAGEVAARALRSRLRAMGLEASIRLPPPGFGDWNEAAGWKGEEEGRGGGPARRG